jgi:hypothetical protein
MVDPELIINFFGGGSRLAILWIPPSAAFLGLMLALVRT